MRFFERFDRNLFEPHSDCGRCDFVGTALALGLGVASAAAGIGSSAIAAHGAGKAAGAQVDAANHAADLQHMDAQQALDFQKQQFGTEQANLAPWLKAGTGAVGQLSDLTQNGGFPDWQGQFQAPTGADAQNDPGFQFRLQQGQQAIERSAASRGGLLSGGTAKALTDYSQGAASQEYGNVYNRRLGEYQQGYNQFEQNQSNKFNRLAALSGVGQTAAGQLGQAGQAASQNVGNILMQSGQQIGNDYQNAGAARASGYAGSANAWGGALSGGTNSIMDAYLLSQLGKKP